MKKILLITTLILAAYSAADAQVTATDTRELKKVNINKNVSTHFVAPEKILYVDISTDSIAGDIPIDNTLRVKPISQGANGVITIVTEQYMVQYLLSYADNCDYANSSYIIPQEEMTEYTNPEIEMSQEAMYKYATNMFISNQKYYDVSARSQLMRLILNNIYTIDNYFFIDISLFNDSNIQYSIDQIRFKVEDKKQTKATNFQSVEILPIMQYLKDCKTFKKKFRNIYVFEKFTFPNAKVFTIEISEKQISGRTIVMKIDYSDILHADSFNEK